MLSQNVLDEAYPIIEKLAKSRSRNGGFAYYEPDDVYQEIWGMCLDAIDRYDPTTGPIENFLVVHVTNRLKNLKRDNYFRPGNDVVSSGLARTRMDLINALPLSDEVVDNRSLWCSAPPSVNPAEHLLCTETVEYIVDRLPDHLVETFESLLTNNPVRTALVDEVRHCVADILIDREEHVES
jgi:DNA-directed RNA polymerase specialized sigma24 family protein